MNPEFGWLDLLFELLPVGVTRFLPGAPLTWMIGLGAGTAPAADVVAEYRARHVHRRRHHAGRKPAVAAAWALAPAAPGDPGGE